ncbi:AEC family transporter [Vagococcus penaei]|uniref:Permease n=1 Tax=Vagococcus penaei TaxID=633807 RepID=A0A1Q2D4E0_9ENTE|nr:AEC family transporter [Vagococcus penaei]AQP53191.1 hypothetical protein BW732_02380 [Vagococcus penaei]
MLANYSTIIVLFAIIAMGYLIARKKKFTKEISAAMSFFVITFSLPAEIFLRITREFTKNDLIAVFKDALLPLLVIILLFLSGFFLAKIFNKGNQTSGGFILCFASPSAAFIGFPIILGLYGDRGLPYALLYYILTSLATWTVGVTLINKDGDRINGTKTTFSVMKLVKEVFSAPVIAFIIAGIFVFMGWHLPTIGQTFFNYIGETTSPLAMLFIGMSIYEIGLSKLKFTKEVLGILVGRFIVAPIIVVVFAKLLNVSSMMAAVCLIQASLPVSNSVAILTGERNIDVDVTDSSLTYSLLAYLVIFPVLMKLIDLFFI